MSIKLIASDLDGTLLNKEGQVSERTKTVIKRVQEEGVTFCIATGRMFRSACQFAKELAIKCPVIAYNGVLIKDPVTDKVMHSTPLDIKVAREVLLYCKKKNWYVQKYEGDFLYVESITGYTERYSSKVNVSVEAQGSAFCQLRQPPYKLMIILEPQEQAAVLQELNEIFGKDIFVTTSNTKFVEIINPCANKGNALSYLCDILDIRKEEVMALGDSFNDIEMLEYAGLAVAMENAVPELKLVSDFVSLDNQKDGVAIAIEKYVLC